MNQLAYSDDLDLKAEEKLETTRNFSQIKISDLKKQDREKRERYRMYIAIVATT